MYQVIGYDRLGGKGMELAPRGGRSYSTLEIAMEQAAEFMRTYCKYASVSYRGVTVVRMVRGLDYTVRTYSV